MPYKEPVYYYNIEQNSDEWDELKLGKLSASDASVLTVKGKNEIQFGTGLLTLLNQRISEVHTGLPSKNFTGNFVTERGHDLEPFAVKEYEETTYNKTKRVGFIQWSDCIGCSPDRLIGTDGGLEVKCPDQTEYTRNLLDFIRGDFKIPKKHLCQIQFCLFVSGRTWWDYFVFNPMFNIKSILIRVERDEEMIELFRLKSTLFEMKLTEGVRLLNGEILQTAAA